MTDKQTRKILAEIPIKHLESIFNEADGEAFEEDVTILATLRLLAVLWQAAGEIIDKKPTTKNMRGWVFPYDHYNKALKECQAIIKKAKGNYARRTEMAKS